MGSPPTAMRARAALPALIAPACAIATIAIALLGLVMRWHTGPSAPVAVVMQAATALGLLLGAAALLLRPPERSVSWRIRRVLAAATAALGAGSLVHYLPLWQSAATVGARLWWMGWPSPNTAVGLTLLGAALFAVDSRQPRRQRWAEVAAGAAAVVALAALVGHAYDARVLYGLSRWSGTAVSTATALGLLALGTLFANPSRGLSALCLSPMPTGHLLRRVMPAAVVAPLLLGWLALALQRSGLADAGFATAILVTSLIVLLGGLLLRQATVLDTATVERERLRAREKAAHERVSDILESITDAFYAVDKAWRFTYLNPEAERILQRSREQLLGRNLWREFPAAVGAAFEREYRRALAQQQAVHFETRYEPLGIWVDVHAYPSAEGLSVYFRDVTERKRAEEKLRESEARYRTLADMIPQHIWTTDAAGYHNYFSRRWYDFSGMTLAQTEGEGWLRLLHPADRERTLARWRQSLRTGEPYLIEYRFLGADGHYHWFLGQAMALRNEAGEIIRWFGTLTDISERKQLEEERELLLHKEQEARAEADRRAAELERMTESRARLMWGFSHDVRNPLTAADGHAWLLESGKLPGELSERQRQSVVRIRRAIRSSLRLIDDLLDLARAEAGQLALERTGLDLSQVARELADDFHAQAAAAKLAIDVQAPPTLPVTSDPHRVRQILANLLSNAVKYAPGGTATIDVAIRRDGGPRPGDWIAVSVTDSGPGIPSDKWALIFEEYARLDTQSQPGAGIGLAISRRIARLLGGDLTVASEVGRGATFTLWLPQTDQSLAAAPDQPGDP